ncbi:50S ribosomal protein L27 [endosymbiont of Pachyrhynchus infernalis]|uniref:50S ribosomal protein L27 n=1 Tax=endosymbiont of Pachyrhynchus infernalis TaxID=1971488 RepID=UPI000DC706C6|nr:50S ribosomal protein L27 [endosymbiont of Pachyrhynchus infernalis]BBA84947.1 50S ribosomal protein L27 [endosymbiont of Pachyrhynchus infernalis]
MAHKKAAGSTKNGRDSIGKRLGIKCYDGENVLPGYIILRQRGMKIRPGCNVKCGRDYTIYSLIKGKVKFIKKNNINKIFVNVIKNNI